MIQVEKDYESWLKENEEKEKELRQASKLARYKSCGVPAKFFDESFDTFITETKEQEQAKNIVKRFADDPKDTVLILYGENGDGKSHLGASVLRQNGGVYILAAMLCVMYESATSYKAKMSREEILNYYSTCDLLVIDECCKYFLNPEVEKFLLSYIVSARAANKLATVLITNSNKESFVEFLGKAVYDRLTELCVTVKFNWTSYRQKKRLAR